MLAITLSLPPQPVQEPGLFPVVTICERIATAYLQPGKPRQNAYIERLSLIARYEWLAQYRFDAVADVQDLATRWIWNYNHEGPNLALGGITPKQRLAMAA